MASSSALADDAGFVLTHPDADEQVRTWTHTHPFWGPSYPLDVYLARERELLTVPLARDGGMANRRRPVLSSCETLRKRALVRAPGESTARDVYAHGVASVFTYPESRRQGHAARMLDLLGRKLADDEARRPGDAAFSVLFSDIGKTFYAGLGWAPFESTHLSLPAAAAVGSPGKDAATAAASARGELTKTKTAATTTPITDENLEPLVALDEKLLRERIALDDAARPTTKTRVAILPDMNHMRWHFTREAFMSTHHLGRAPAVHGALYTNPSDGSRVWAIWARVHSGGTTDLAKNVLYIQRSVVENPGISDSDLTRAWRAILEAARAEAHEWMCTRVDMWNPDERTRRLIIEMDDLHVKHIIREEDSIASLRWFGDGSVQDIEWVANERYEWC
ncbi:hypothetical protein JDV02_000148 [Purpureocillium takamizusanense]|uniref:LYC1 C-terminal domain-containing protein n=1 Tax=Purpureocillium takamizusanense TaxID=2060973 RepID=A0A9Q8V567_9HYPO|nr:uncharacterized protein JDV02_000148 [Purpureocillium takamizusanense]UNI13400.1 hypothetical protein JDV02_000148 [Purpureocillium takamizusanense]